MQESEIALVKRMQDGDETAFDDLYHIYYDRATAIALVPQDLIVRPYC